MSLGPPPGSPVAGVWEAGLSLVRKYLWGPRFLVWGGD